MNITPFPAITFKQDVLESHFYALRSFRQMLFDGPSQTAGVMTDKNLVPRV